MSLVCKKSRWSGLWLHVFALTATRKVTELVGETPLAQKFIDRVEQEHMCIYCGHEKTTRRSVFSSYWEFRDER